MKHRHFYPLLTLLAFAMLVGSTTFLTGCETDSKNSNHNYLPKNSDIQNKYNYNYYEAYTFSYRYAYVKASLNKDNYWARFYAKHWDKYSHDKGHRNRLSQERFWRIMEHADKEANK